MILLSHRGNLSGISGSRENTLEQLRQALERGFGIETDIRRTVTGELYISHDPASDVSGKIAADHAALWRQFPRQPVALNIKETGYDELLVDFLVQHDLVQQVFLFDFELLEGLPGKTARSIRSLHQTVRLAARASDRYGETIEQALSIECADVVWLDEFDGQWARSEDISRLKQAGRLVYAISPEIHGFPLELAERRWQEFADWGVDGVCTDWPQRAAELLGPASAPWRIVGQEFCSRRLVKKHRLDDMIRGWFVGSFSPTALNTGACEVACKRYRAGDHEDRHFHKLATEVTLVLEGRVVMNGIQWNAGDIIVVEPNEAVEFEALEDAVTVVVKVPGASNDKYPGVPPQQ
jgi:glycerophosphoryl diester phosphodiesterase